MQFASAIKPEILCEQGAASRLGDIIAQRFDARSAMIVSDWGIVDAGLLDDPIASLNASGIETIVYNQIASDPPEYQILECLSAMSDAGADMVIGVGGGSPLDAAKAVAIKAGTAADMDSLYGIDNVVGQRLPLVLVPTVGGTGSETSNFSVITRDDGSKVSITSPQTYGDLAILDAQLCVGLPAHLTAATGIDAIAHAIEAFTSKGNKNDVGDGAALEAISLLFDGVPAAVKNGNDLDAREKALVGGALAGIAISHAPVGGVHALAYPLGGIHHIHHGLSNAILLPHVLRFNMVEAEDEYAQLAAAAGGTDLVKMVEGLIDATGIQKTLKEVGISHDQLPQLAAEAMKIERLLKNNPRPVGYEDAVGIYAAAYGSLL